MFSTASPALVLVVLDILNRLSVTRAADRKVCVVEAGLDEEIDDAPAIVKAFEDCNNGGTVQFVNHTYFVHTIMNTTGLNDVEVELKGTLQWSNDTEYWLANSMDMGYQNQSTAWFFGGKNIHWKGYGYGTLNGNGDVWVDCCHSSNYPHRPHQITIWETYDSVFEGIRFIKSQMWTMTVKNSENVLLQDIFVGNSKSGNTDGANTVYAKNITFNRWHVINGDDAISVKANSSEIYIYDSIFEDGQGLAIGSIGQFLGWYEYIENVYAKNITLKGTKWAMYVKTWTGAQVDYPPNGGGGGLGYAKNITLTDTKLDDTSGVFSITQCNSFSGHTGDCDSSKFQLSDFHWTNISGTTGTSNVVNLDCSGAAPCTGIEVSSIDLAADGEVVDGYACDHVEDTIGFECD